MKDAQLRPVLAGKKALVIGIANQDSIAYGCAKAFRSLGADLAVSWLNEKARRFVEPLAEGLEAPITAEVDVSAPGQLEAIFEQIRTRWGTLDILVHSIAFAPKADLQGGSSTVSPKASPRQWTYRAIPSSGWPSWRRR
jgi:enoyl-[acyl-carrier protein] reductase I